MKNKILTFITFFIRKCAQLGKSRAESHFLIISTTGVGDTLWATPALKNLKCTFPQSRIVVVTSPLGKEVLHNNPYIDQLYVLTDPIFFQLYKLYKDLRQYRFGTAIFFHASQRALLPLASMLGIPSIIGNVGMHKGLDNLLTYAIPRADHHHEIQRRLALLQPLGVHRKESALEIHLAKEEYTLPAKLETGDWVILHPGASHTFKQWPEASYLELGRTLATELQVQIAITGNADEAALCTRIAEGIPRAISLAGEISLRTFAAFCAKARLLITNDTGPMHLAFAQNLPTIAIFSPTNPKFCGPYKIHHACPLYVRKTCFPCLGKRCQSPFCLLQISPGEVIELAKKMIRPNLG